MARYKVTFLSQDGIVNTEIVEAKNESELFSLFSERDVILLEYKKDWFSFLKEFSLLDLFQRRKISKQELADFCFYFGRALDMGISVLEILEDIGKSSKNKYFRKVMETLRERVTAGSSLSEAMELTGAFPPELIGLVKVGESTDALPKVFLNYAEYLDWVISIEKEVKQALSYPIFVSFIMVFTIAIMFGYIIPQIIPAITAMGLKEYPLPTKILLWSGKYVQIFWKEIVITPILLVIFFKLIMRYSIKARYIWDRLKISFPLIGDIFQKASLSRDMRALAEVYRSGGTILRALDIIINHVEQNLYIKSIFQKVKENIMVGDMLSVAMERSGFFQSTIIRMIKLGEETGALDKSLLRLAEIYEDDMRRKIQTMTVVIEPTLQLVLGGILGIVALGILLPVYNIISGLR
ncbi:Type II secretion system F domain [Desulfurobacterium thermolithotrophum DSM 11699]|uniref:Type II secretion system F domain n=1 Tax=Desulfurobacterium thermolithotrophum (strain DSM 11699 / BSA) TaxID=868864 RepID=F0S200_DESTD|nr:type II secretion system F family protein [Desulfurobacterium thermolithotrophum]ADY74081.1 Type II secretion system F domain [Desulfurobacterium thermolithotrophum DSM 11699]